MMHQHEPLSAATITLLRLLRVRITKQTVDKTLQNHPDWPTLLSVTDSLTAWKIPCAAGRGDENNIDHLPTPFLAFFDQPDLPVAVVSHVSTSTVTLHQNGSKRTTIVSREQFLLTWNGAFVVAEPKEYLEEADFLQKKYLSLFNRYAPFAAALVFLTLALMHLNDQMAASNPLRSPTLLAGLLQCIILMLGVTTTGLLIWIEMDRNNPFLQKICTTGTNMDCLAVLTSKQAKISNRLSWSELGLFYFSGGVIALLFAGRHTSETLSVVAWLNVPALPFIAYSIYYQWRVIRQWCKFCLMVQGLLLLGVLNVAYAGLLDSFLTATHSFNTQIFLSYALPTLTWYAIKPAVTQLIETDKLRQAHRHLKYDADVFQALLEKQKKISKPVGAIGIHLGDPSARNTLIKVCSPYCGPCARSYPELEQLLDRHSDLQATIIFNTPDNDNSSAIPVRHLMSIDSCKEKSITQKALSDWYLSGRDYPSFAQKYPPGDNIKQQGKKMAEMENWCTQMGVHFTPSVFINGYQLPDGYTIADLDYFLHESSLFNT